MNLVYEVEIPGTPVAVQSVRSAMVGKFIRHYQPAKVTNWKGYIRAFIANTLPADWQPLDCALMVMYEFVFPPLKTSKKRTLEAINDGVEIYKATRPDLGDNLKKGLNDALTGIIWKDDSLIVADSGIKVYGNQPHIRIRVYSGLRTE